MPSRWLAYSSQYVRSGLFNPLRLSSPRKVTRSFCTSSICSTDVVPLRKQLKDANRRARSEPDCSLADRLHENRNSTEWELTVGIEIHAQLNSIRKLFSRSRPESEGEPNTSLAPFDIAVPGSQPLLQLSSIIPALRAAIALNCDIEPVSRFDRKHYFYHDQPSGYQITQYYQPFARNGSVTLTPDDGLPAEDGTELVVGIKQIQMEQDTAKTQELEDGTSSINFARSGQPLIEIISLPQIHSPGAAAAYLRKIQATLFSVDSVTTGMELGGLRADVNVSVRKSDGPMGKHTYSGVTGLGQRTEIKNLSSFKAVEDAIRAERERQIAVLEAGGQIEGETRGWTLTSPNETRRLRGKEGEVDYRYMPDPDIPPLRIAVGLVDHLRRHLPPLPEQLVATLVNHYGLTPVDARAMIALEDGQRMIYFQEVAESIPAMSDAEQLKNRKNAGNWVLHELGALLSTSDTKWTPELVPVDSLARIIQLQGEARITGASAKQVLRKVFEGDKASVDDIVTRENLWFEALSDDDLRSLASKVIANNADMAAAIKKGNHRKIGFFVGQMMRSADSNRIDAKKAESALKSLLLG